MCPVRRSWRILKYHPFFWKRPRKSVQRRAVSPERVHVSLRTRIVPKKKKTKKKKKKRTDVRSHSCSHLLIYQARPMTEISQQRLDSSAVCAQKNKQVSVVSGDTAVFTLGIRPDYKSQKDLNHLQQTWKFTAIETLIFTTLWANSTDDILMFFFFFVFFFLLFPDNRIW